MRRRARFFVVAALVGSALAACGADGASEVRTDEAQAPADARAQLASASEALEGAGTAAFDVIYEFSDVAVPDVRGTGRLDAASGRSEFVIPLPDSGGLELRLVQDASVFHISIDGERWASMEVPGVTEGVEAAVSGGGADPVDVLGGMADAPGLRSVGTEEIGGLETNHFQARITGAALDAVFGPEGAASMGGSGEGFIVYDAWVDDGGLLRRITVDYGGGEEVLMSMTWDVRDHGRTPPIELPAPEAVVLRERVADLPTAMQRALETLTE